MKAFRQARGIALILALVNWVVPVAETSATQPPQTTPTPSLQTPSLRPTDVALAPGGRLSGQLLNRSAQPQSGLVVVAVQNNRQVARAVTDQAGQFTLEGLRGGLVQIVAPQAISICRAWAPGTAPPSATNQLLVIQQDVLQRGQMPFGEALFSDPILLGLFVAAAIAIPIAVSNSRDKHDAS